MTVLLLGKRIGLAGLSFGWWTELRNNRRAAVGLLAIGLIVACYGWFALRDRAAGLQDQYDQQAIQLQRVTEVASEHQWAQRAAESDALRKQLEDQLWRGESEGVARADLQDWISAGARQIGLPSLDVRIETTRPKGLPPDLLRITATITARPSEAALIALLGYVDRSPHRVVLERFNVKQQPSPSLEMTLVAHARIGVPEPAR